MMMDPAVPIVLQPLPNNGQNLARPSDFASRRSSLEHIISGGGRRCDRGGFPSELVTITGRSDHTPPGACLRTPVPPAFATLPFLVTRFSHEV